MKEYIKGLAEAVRVVFEANDHTDIEVKYVHSEILGGELVQLPASTKEVTYGQMKFKHSVRAIISYFVKQGLLLRIARGRYRWIG
jgi:hypothetical protein